MSSYIKPIQPTPVLGDADAVKIIKQALTVPSKSAVERNKKKLELRKRYEKK